MYVLKDKGYPFLPWLKIPPCKQNVNVKCILLKVFYNIRHFYRGRNVVENAFKILIKIIKKLWKNNLHIVFF